MTRKRIYQRVYARELRAECLRLGLCTRCRVADARPDAQDCEPCSRRKYLRRKAVLAAPSDVDFSALALGITG